MDIGTSDIIALCAVVIAVLSFFVTIWESYTSRSHNRLMVKPHLYIDLNVVSTEPIRLVLKNNGLGPALIKSLRMFVEGKEISSSGEKLYNEAMKFIGLDEYSFHFFLLTSDHAFSVGDEIDLFVFDNNELDEEDILVIKKNLDKLNIVIKYESIYGVTYQYDDKNHLTSGST